LADDLGTWNKLNWGSQQEKDELHISAVAAYTLPSISLPNIPNATIQLVRLKFRAQSYRRINNGYNTLTVQIKKGAGAWTDAITFSDVAMPLFANDNTKVYELQGHLDISSIVDVFNQSYDVRINVTAWASDVYLYLYWSELEVYYTVDSGVEAKIDIIDTNVDDIETDTSDMQPRVVAIETDTNEIQGKLPTNKIMGSSVVTDKDLVIDAIKADTGRLYGSLLYGGASNQFSVVTDGSNTASSFKTDIPSGWGDDYFNDMIFVIHDAGTTPAFQARRISAFNSTTQFLTVDTPLDSVPDSSHKFRIIMIWTPALVGGNDWTAGEKQNIRQALGVTGTKAATSGGNLDDVHGKLPSKSYLRGTADSDGGMDTEDKADIEAECGDALTAYDPPTRTEATADKDEIIVEVNANETKIDALQVDVTSIEGKVDVIDGIVDDILLDTDAIDTRLPSDPADQSLVEAAITAAVDTLDGADDRDHTEIYDAVTAIQNNTRFTYSVPQWMQKPDAGDEAYRMSGNLMDITGAMEDPDDNEILVRVLQDDGTPITATLYKENGLTNPLDNATDQVNFPSGSGWRAMERLGVGRYDFFYKVTSTATEEHLTVEFGWTEGGGSPIFRSASTIISDVKGDLEDIQTKVDAIYVKSDAVTPSPTIPAQIATHDTDIKAMPRVQATPDEIYVPAGRSRINISGGITAIATEIPVLDETAYKTDGVVKIESEFIIYVGITDSKLQVTQRGAYGSTPAAHDNNVEVLETLVYNVRLHVFDNEGNMTNADSTPTIEIEDWKGTQELAPTSMTSISTGIYGYDFLLTRGDLAENKIFIFDVTANSINMIRQHEVVIIDIPASESVFLSQNGGIGKFVCDQNGWYDIDGILTAWGDELEGVVEDADTGAPLFRAFVTAYLISNGEPLFNGRPPGQAKTRVNGTWLMYLDDGTYQFVIEKDGFRIKDDGLVERTVG